jgi:hypothetical protein
MTKCTVFHISFQKVIDFLRERIFMNYFCNAMPTITFFNAIKTQLLNISSFDQSFNNSFDASMPQFVQMWNNQLDSLKAKDTEANIMYSFSLPALFIEFANLETQQLGNGNQIYPDLIVRIHILHRLEDAGDGTLEQNLAVLNLRDAVQLALQNFRPAGASEFIRQKQLMDYSHNNVYHYSVDYGCTYVDTLTSQPVDAVTTSQRIAPVINSSYNPPPFIIPS